MIKFRKKTKRKKLKRGLCAEEAGRYVIAKSGLPLSATCRLSQGFRFVEAGHRTCSHRPPHPGRLASDEKASTVTQASLKSHKISCFFSNSAGISSSPHILNKSSPNNKKQEARHVHQIQIQAPPEPCPQTQEIESPLMGGELGISGCPGKGVDACPLRSLRFSS